MAEVHRRRRLVEADPDRPLRERNRRTVACARCRSRKLRCDREYPTLFSRCRANKAAAECTLRRWFSMAAASHRVACRVCL